MVYRRVFCRVTHLRNLTHRGFGGNLWKSKLIVLTMSAGSRKSSRRRGENFDERDDKDDAREFI